MKPKSKKEECKKCKYGCSGAGSINSPCSCECHIEQALEEARREAYEDGAKNQALLDAGALEEQRKEIDDLKDKLGGIVEASSNEFGTDYDAIAEELINLLFKLGWLKRTK